MIARTHIVYALLTAAGAGLVAAGAAAIFLPLDREARSINGRVEAFAGDLASAGLIIEDDWDLEINRQVLRIAVTDVDATCDSWAGIATEAITVAEASDLSFGVVESERD